MMTTTTARTTTAMMTTTTMIATMILMTMMMLRRLLSSWLTRPPPAQSATAVTRPPMSVLALELDNDVKEEDQDGEEEDSWIGSLSLNKIWVNWGEKIRVRFVDFYIVENHSWQIDGKFCPSAFCWWQTVVEILLYKIILGRGSRSRSHFVARIGVLQLST